MQIHYRRSNSSHKGWIIPSHMNGKAIKATHEATDQTRGRPGLGSVWVALGRAVEGPVKSPAVRNTIAISLQ